MISLIGGGSLHFSMRLLSRFGSRVRLTVAARRDPDLDFEQREFTPQTPLSPEGIETERVRR